MIGIIIGVGIIGVGALIIHEIGEYAEEINPFNTEDEVQQVYEKSED